MKPWSKTSTRSCLGLEKSSDARPIGAQLDTAIAAAARNKSELDRQCRMLKTQKMVRLSLRSTEKRESPRCERTHRRMSQRPTCSSCHARILREAGANATELIAPIETDLKEALRNWSRNVLVTYQDKEKDDLEDVERGWQAVANESLGLCGKRLSFLSSA